MLNLIIGVSKYIFLITLALFTLLSFITLTGSRSKGVRFCFFLQSVALYVFHVISGIVIFANIEDITVIAFYIIGLIYFIMFRGLHTVFYEEAYDRGVMNDMCMLLDIGFVMLCRLDYQKAIKQFLIVIVISIVAIIIPVIIRKSRILAHLTYLYCFAGLGFLISVLIVGNITKGAKLFLSFHGFTFQPSEFVKILFVFFLAAFLSKDASFGRIVLSAFFAGLHIIILVISRDLGSALIFFMVYIIMIYIASKHIIYIFAGLSAGGIAAVAGYYLFSHVRIRVQAFLHPYADMNGTSYQISRSLLAIATGGFMGLGLYKGSPNKIPEVEMDFMFSAISHELGAFFAIILIILCASCFISFANIAMRQRDMFYKLIGVGLSITYAVQTVLTIGGAIKFIPSTGVTLPLISYGGSSVLCTIIMFGVFQGISVHAFDDEENEYQQNLEQNNSKSR